MAGYFGFRFLYRNQPLSLYYYAVPRLCLNLMGFWPGPLQWRALVHFVVLAIGVATELHAGFSFARAGKITMALETFCPAGTSAVTLLKMFFMLRYRQDLLYVLTHQRQLLFQKKPLSVEKKQLMRRHSEMAARFNFWPLSAGFFTCTMYNLKPMLLAMLLYLQGRSDAIAWSTTPFNMTMPRWLLHAPYFPLTYMFIAYTGYVTIFMFGGCDAFYFEFCVHTATLFNFLQADTRALFRPYKGLAQIIGLRSTRFEASLVQLIERHNKIFELTHFFRQRYAIITLAHFVSASMVIGFSIFDLLTVGGSGLGTLLYVGYTVAALSQLVIYCYGGTLVTESVSAIRLFGGVPIDCLSISFVAERSTGHRDEHLSVAPVPAQASALCVSLHHAVAARPHHGRAILLALVGHLCRYTANIWFYYRTGQVFSVLISSSAQSDKYIAINVKPNQILIA